jgi:RNA polymerase sigma-70 factor (ECF subfamily)
MSEPVRGQLQQAMKKGYIAAYRLLGNADESRDACQEAAARALSASERYDASKPFYPWFYRILKNHCIDRLKQRRRVVPMDKQHERPREPGAGSEAMALEGEWAQEVARAIASLDDDLREIIELRHFQDASYDEMAQILGCPTGTVMSRLYRARKALRAKLVADPRFMTSSPSSAGGRR